MTFRIVPALLPVIAAAALAGSAQAATLKLIDHRSELIRNGQHEPAPGQDSMRANPDDVLFSIDFEVNIETSEASPEIASTLESEQIGIWEIEADEGEVVGDPVCYQYAHEHSLSVTASGQAAAGAIIGGQNPLAEASASLDPPPGSYDYSVDVTGPGGIEVNGVEMPLAFGPAEVTEGNSLDGEESGVFLTSIGETITLHQAFAAAAAALHPGSAEVRGSTEIAFSETDLAQCYPSIGLTPDSLDFGNREVGTTSDPLSILLENGGPADLEVDSISAAGASFSTADGSCATPPFSLPAGSSCTLEYTFSPDAPGPATETVTLESNAPDAPHEIQLQGNGIQAGLVLDPGVLDFGNQEVGTGSSPISVSIENSGDAELRVESATSPIAPFAAADGTCGSAPFTLTPGATCTLGYSFSPAATGEASQSIALKSNAPDGPHQFELQGNGTQAETVLSLDNVDFGEQAFGTSSEPRSITISNAGDADLVIDDIDNPQPPFEITGGSCYPLPATIAPGESCMIEARMSPTSWSGSFTGEILIFSNSPSSPDRVGLRGTSPAPLPVPTLGLPFAVLLILSILAITRRWHRQHARG
ncbi:choice-of-anchor D domain-containing protein [Wenzhouxiangella sp. EGI_FJ10305]|uniref:choice-of-anchor D domain-containing protein n=1 Tax=Wenzhouxiangella sp. EGI_FJ10305 TaxID=3243768 RepID=UPI0035DEF1BF